MSALEAFTNATLGVLVSIIAVRFLWPVFGWEATGGQAVGVTALFWALSFGRNYAVREFFKWLS